MGGDAKIICTIWLSYEAAMQIPIFDSHPSISIFIINLLRQFKVRESQLMSPCGGKANVSAIYTQTT